MVTSGKYFSDCRLVTIVCSFCAWLPVDQFCRPSTSLRTAEVGKLVTKQVFF
jgi:hypothetical protein